MSEKPICPVLSRLSQAFKWDVLFSCNHLMRRRWNCRRWLLLGITLLVNLIALKLQLKLIKNCTSWSFCYFLPLTSCELRWILQIHQVLFSLNRPLNTQTDGMLPHVIGLLWVFSTMQHHPAFLKYTTSQFTGSAAVFPPPAPEMTNCLLWLTSSYSFGI